MVWRSVVQGWLRQGFGVFSIGAVLGVGAVVLALAGGGESDALAGTQQCNTACQTKMTDCILSCDGVLECELACKSRAVDCVSACSFDAGPLTTNPPDGSSEASQVSIDAGRPKDAAREALGSTRRGESTGDDAGRPRARDQ
jgi:hypothetical protein